MANQEEDEKLAELRQGLEGVREAGLNGAAAGVLTSPLSTNPESSTILRCFYNGGLRYSHRFIKKGCLKSE